MHAEKNYWMHLDQTWESRIHAAFGKYIPLWEEVWICLQLKTVRLIPNNVTTTDTWDEVDDEYVDWLDVNGYDGKPYEAYQLWTGRVFTDSVVGVAAPGETFHQNHQANAASVVQGIDWGASWHYDAHNARDRGLLSGHEMGHVYGAEHHTGRCHSEHVKGDYNIMQPDFRSWQSFCFTLQGKREITCRYFATGDPC